MTNITTFTLFSDFHTEMNDLYAWEKSDDPGILVLAGDCANSPVRAMRVIDEAKEHFEHVIFVDGNHEHYNNYTNSETINTDMLTFWKYALDDPKLTYLDGTNFHIIGDVVFIGANGWYDYNATPGVTVERQRALCRQVMNDTKCCRFEENYEPEDWAKLHSDGLASLVSDFQFVNDINSIVLITHTLPIKTAFGRYGDPTHPFYATNGAFLNSQMNKVWEADTNNKIKTWCFGHTHDKRDFFEHGIHFVCNPRGYKSEWAHMKLRPRTANIIDIEQTEIRSAFGEIDE